MKPFSLLLVLLLTVLQMMLPVKSLGFGNSLRVFSSVRNSMLMMSSTSGNIVGQMKPMQFRDILTTDSRSLFQIIDVREPHELEMANIKVMNDLNNKNRK